MINLLGAIFGKKINKASGFKAEFQEVHDNIDKLREEIYKHDTADKMMKTLIPSSLWSDDPIIRAKRLAEGVYDKYVGNLDFVNDYKESCKTLLRKFDII